LAYITVERQIIAQSKLSCTELVVTLTELGAYTVVCVVINSQRELWVEDNV